MKIKLTLSGFLLLLTFTITSAQKTSLMRMNLQERKSEIRKMSSAEKKAALVQFKEDLVISELQIPEDRKEDFLEIYSEYQDRQKAIKSKFKPARDFENMSDDQANKELDNSFQIGQELLDLRKEFAEKFGTVVKPQKVLQLFQTEGMMRSKMMNHQNPR